MNEFKEKLTELLSQIKEKAHTVTEMIKEKAGDGADWVKTHKKIALPIAAILLCLCLAGGGVLIAGSVMDNQPSGKITAEKEKDTEETLSADVSEEDTLDGTDENGDITEDPASEEADADADTVADDAAAVSKSDQSSDQKASDKTSKSTASTSKSSSKNTSSNQTSKPSGSKGNASSSKPSSSNSGSASVSKPSNSGSASKPSSGNTSAPSTPSKPAHTHSYTSSVTTQPTCCNPGVRTYTCSCGSSYTESIPATGNHNWVAQTMEQPVYDWHIICNGCGKDFGSGPAAADEALNHIMSSDFYGPCQNYSSKYVQVGTTTVTIGYKCSTCGATK